MSNPLGFYPQSPTVMANITSASTGGISQSTGGGYQAARIQNISTGPNIFVRISQTQADVPVLPLSSVGSTAAYGFPIAQNQSEVFTIPPNSFVSAMSTAATMTAVMAVTYGFGKK